MTSGGRSLLLNGEKLCVRSEMILRKEKEYLGYLITLEMGKIYQEGMGEVQEMIDICDFAVGQARLLNGLYNAFMNDRITEFMISIILLVFWGL